MNLLLIIDLQKDFINENTASCIEDINTLMNDGKFDKILFTKFINSENSPCYKKTNWKLCMTKEGQEICIDTKNNKVINKTTFTAYNIELIDYMRKNNIKNIYCCGIDVDCCVLATAINLFENDYNVYVLKDYCYCFSGEERKQKAIEMIEINIGKDYVI